MSSAITFASPNAGHEHRVDRQLGVGDRSRGGVGRAAGELPDEPGADRRGLEPDEAGVAEVQHAEEAEQEARRVQHERRNRARDAGQKEDDLRGDQHTGGGVLGARLAQTGGGGARQVGTVEPQQRRTQVPLRRDVDGDLAGPARHPADLKQQSRRRPFHRRDLQPRAVLGDGDPRQAGHHLGQEAQPVDQLGVRRRLEEIARVDAPDLGQHPVQVEPVQVAVGDEQLTENGAGALRLLQRLLQHLLGDHPTLQQSLAET